MAPSTNLNLQQFKTMIRGAHYMIPINASLSTNTPSAHTPFPSTSDSPIRKPLQLVRNLVPSLSLHTDNQIFTPGQNDTEYLVCGQREHILLQSIMAIFALWLALMVLFGMIFGFYAWIIYRSEPSPCNYTGELSEVVSVTVVDDAEAEAERLRRLEEHRDSVTRCGIVNKCSREIDIGAGRAFAAARAARPEGPRPVPSYGAMERRYSSDSSDSAYSF